MLEDENGNWEQEISQRLERLLAQRVQPLQEELAQAQAALGKLQETLQQQTAGQNTADHQALLDYVREQLVATTQQKDAELEAQLSRTRLQLESNYEQRLAQALQEERDQHEARLAQLQLTQVAPAATVAASTAPDYGKFRVALEELNQQRTQSETLTSLLQRAADYAPRLAFFVVRGVEVVGWKTVGFTNGLHDESVRSLAVSLQAQSLLGRALNTQTTGIVLAPTQAEIATVLGRFSHPVPQAAVAVPLVVRGKAAAVLYADSGDQSEEAIQLEAIEALTQIASLVIELLPLRRNLQTAQSPAGTSQSFHTNSPSNPPSIAHEAPAASSSGEHELSAPPQEEAPEYVSAPALAPADQAKTPAPAYAVGVPHVTTPAIGDANSSPFPFNPALAANGIDEQQNAPIGSPIQQSVYDAEPVTALSQASAAERGEAVAERVTEEALVYQDAVRSNDPMNSPLEATMFERLRHGALGTETAAAPTPPPPPPAVMPPLPLVTSEPMAPRSIESAPQPSARPENLPPISTALPAWMQRLQDVDKESIAPNFAPAATPALANWGNAEEAFSTAPELNPAGVPPPPPTPPPMRLPAVGSWMPKEEEEKQQEPLPQESVPTLDAPPVAAPVPVVESAPANVPPVVAVPNFNQPSEPPRYAAPSLSVSTAASETEVRAHNDARRFARLLVSEIKLYNAAKVNEGRRNADLYDRLHDEIDRSRKVYDKRVSAAVSTKFDYFYDELVQTLAEGDAAKLGESCPGPAVGTA